MTTYYCNASAGGAGDGSAPDIANAWTIAQLNTAVGAGGALDGGSNTVYMIGAFSSLLTIAASGQDKDNPLIIRGDYDTVDSSYAAGVISGTGTYCIYLNQGAATGDNLDFVTVKNITVDSSGNNLAAMLLLGNAAGTGTYLVVDGVIVTNPQQTGIYYATSATDNTGCEIKNCIINIVADTARAIRVNAINGVYIHDNVCTSTSTSPNANTHAGINLSSSASLTRVQDNTITGEFDACIHIEDTASNSSICNNTITGYLAQDNGKGIFIREICENNLIQGNIIRGGSLGILDDTTAAVTTANVINCNLVYDYYTNGIDYRSDTAGYTYLCNNTVIHNPLASAGHGIVIQIQAAATANAYIYNNIVVCIGDGTNINGMMVVEADSNDVTVGYNRYYRIGTGQVFGVNGTDLATDTVAGWEAELTGAGAEVVAGTEEVVTTSPFTDYANGDYTLLSTSSAVGEGIRWWTSANPIGTNGEPVSDFDVDIGAYPSLYGPFHPVNL